MSRRLSIFSAPLSAVLSFVLVLACLSTSASSADDAANNTNNANDTDQPTATQQQTALLARYQQLKDTLAHSIFGAPIQLNSNIHKRVAQGEVFAVLNTPLTALRKTLSQPAQWCDLAILHINIKTCLYGNDWVKFFVGRKYYQTPDAAFELQYHFSTVANTDQYLNIKLTAADGPLGTSDYLIKLEATAIDAEHSFIRFEYRYRFGFMGKLAMQTYLATLGRHKVGFTVTGTDDNGDPIYIKGLQGVIERNVMRYIFAIQSVLETKPAAGTEQHTAQLKSWYTHIEQHPRQLVELSREEYMENKKRELANQLEMQGAMQP